MDFEDFMKSRGVIMTGMPLQNDVGLFPVRKRAFPRRLKKFEIYF